MSIIIPENVSELIKAIRIRLGLNQKEFGELLGVRQASISDYERAKIKPTKSVWSSICHRYPDMVPFDGDTNPEKRSEIDPTTAYLVDLTKEILLSKSDYAKSLETNIKILYQGLEAERRYHDMVARMQFLENASDEGVLIPERRKGQRRLKDDPDAIPGKVDRRINPDRRVVVLDKP